MVDINLQINLGPQQGTVGKRNVEIQSRKKDLNRARVKEKLTREDCSYECGTGIRWIISDNVDNITSTAILCNTFPMQIIPSHLFSVRGREPAKLNSISCVEVYFLYLSKLLVDIFVDHAHKVIHKHPKPLKSNDNTNSAQMICNLWIQDYLQISKPGDSLDGIFSSSVLHTSLTLSTTNHQNMGCKKNRQMWRQLEIYTMGFQNPDRAIIT